MPEQYTYNLTTLAAQGSNPQQPVFARSSTNRPAVTIMDSLGADNNNSVPSQSLLLTSKKNAKNIRDKKIPYPAELEERSYDGIDHHRMPTSKGLIADTQLMGPAAGQLTIFDDFVTAEFYRGILRPNKRVEDPTIPQTREAMQAHVDLLVRAFKSTFECDDNGPMIRPFVERRHDSKLVECLCWSIVKACIQRARSDEPLLTAYEPAKAKNSLGLDSFEKRFDAISLSMARSKTICKHMFDAPYINTFVDDPLKSIRRVDTNRALNKQKAQVMAKGKGVNTQQQGGAACASKKAKTGRKRSATAAGLDHELSRQMLALPIAAAQAQPTNGRVTRRMSRIMAEPEASPYGTPSTLRSQMGPSPMPSTSPMSSETEIKDESSPMNNQQSYGAALYNGARVMGMQGHGYDQNLMQGITFPLQRYGDPNNMSYSYGGTMPRTVYGNGMPFTPRPAANSGMHYYDSPVAPQGLTMNNANRFYEDPFTNADVQGDEDSFEDHA